MSKNDLFIVPCEPLDGSGSGSGSGSGDYDYDYDEESGFAEGLCSEDTKLALSNNFDCLYEVYEFPGRKMGFW